ncbi:MAG: glutaredoxin domain-containing protein [Wenzhouxiangella sp.]
MKRFRGLMMLAGFWLWAGVSSAAAAVELEIVMFSSDRCPYCQAQRPFLDDLAARDEVVLSVLDIARSSEHHATFRAMAAAHGVDTRSVPAVFIGGRAWIGDSPDIRSQIRRWVDHCLAEGCPDSRRLAQDTAAPETAGPATADRPALDLPLLGRVDLADQPLLLTTLLIAAVDGFNPCSLWVLTILLALVLHSGSRQRVLIVGFTFLLVTAAIYGVFILGVFSVLHLLAYVGWIQWLVAGLALVFALVNIKDYFYFQRGLSFTIDDRHKPGIFRRIRGLLSEQHSLPTLILATLVMAAGIALIELPCTAGFPVVWSGIIAAHQLDWTLIGVLLLVYLLVYLSIEIVIFLVAVVTLRIDRFEQRHGRLLKLVGGMVMLALGLMLIFAPDLMQDLGGTLLLFGGALLLAGLIVLLHRKILPWLGIRLGDDW